MRGMVHDTSQVDPKWPHQPLQPIIDNIMRGRGKDIDGRF